MRLDRRDEQLAALNQRYRDLAAELAEIGLISAGSLTCRYTRCTAPGCRCNAEPPERHGPYWQWTAKVSGRTVTRRLSSAEAELYREWIANDRKLRAVVAEMRQVAGEAAELLLQQVVGQGVKV